MSRRYTFKKISFETSIRTFKNLEMLKLRIKNQHSFEMKRKQNKYINKYHIANLKKDHV